MPGIGRMAVGAGEGPVGTAQNKVSRRMIKRGRVKTDNRHVPSLVIRMAVRTLATL